MDTEHKLRIGIVALACGVAIAIGTVAFWRALWMLSPEVMLPLITAHFAAVIMLPLCAMSSLVIVMIFRSASGPLEFEGLGFKFKGAAGDTVMWICCLLTLSWRRKRCRRALG